MEYVKFDALPAEDISNVKEFYVNPESFGDFCNRFGSVFDPTVNIKDFPKLGHFYSKVVIADPDVPLNFIAIRRE